MLFDSHTHTVFSFDAEASASPDAMCESAIRAGLSGIAFTDHMDINGEMEGIYAPFDAEGAFRAVSEAKEKYRNVLRVSCGIELGQATEYPEAARAFLAAHPYDFVLGSIHNLPAVPDFYYMRYDDMPQQLYGQLFSRTLDEALKLCDFDGIHAIAHLTYMQRYLVEAGRTLDFSPHKEKLECLFRKMIQRDIALELNVSLLRKGIDLFMPEKELLSLYRDLGGTLFTVGSDAHSPDAVGSGIRAGYELLESIGISSVLFFQNGTAEAYPLR